MQSLYHKEIRCATPESLDGIERTQEKPQHRLGTLTMDSVSKVSTIDQVTKVLPSSLQLPPDALDLAPILAEEKKEVTTNNPRVQSPKYGNIHAGRSLLLQKRLQTGNIHHFDSAELYKRKTTLQTTNEGDMKPSVLSHPQPLSINKNISPCSPLNTTDCAEELITLMNEEDPNDHHGTPVNRDTVNPVKLEANNRVTPTKETLLYESSQ
ncbi:hypothetical protein WA158_003232 [Blastocystis sp. Blastoise]